MIMTRLCVWCMWPLLAAAGEQSVDALSFHSNKPVTIHQQTAYPPLEASQPAGRRKPLACQQKPPAARSTIFTDEQNRKWAANRRSVVRCKLSPVSASASQLASQSVGSGSGARLAAPLDAFVEMPTTQGHPIQSRQPGRRRRRRG